MVQASASCCRGLAAQVLRQLKLTAGGQPHGEVVVEGMVHD